MKTLGLLLVGAGMVLIVSPAMARHLVAGLTLDGALRICGLLVALLGVLVIAGRKETAETGVPRPPVAYSAPSNDQPTSSLHEELSREVMMVLEREGKINAIKLVRERTGLGLKEAKEAVEDLERRARR